MSGRGLWGGETWPKTSEWLCQLLPCCCDVTRMVTRAMGYAWSFHCRSRPDPNPELPIRLACFEELSGSGYRMEPKSETRASGTSYSLPFNFISQVTVKEICRCKMMNSQSPLKEVYFIWLPIQCLHLTANARYWARPCREEEGTKKGNNFPLNK